MAKRKKSRSASAAEGGLCRSSRGGGGAVVLAALMLGAGATVLVFEVVFRITGAALLGAQRAKYHAKDARFTILCEGDSFTYGLGGEDYPAQLERTLNRRAGKKLYRVVNKGLPGMNTAVLANQLDRHITQYRPDVLIVLAGEDNAWNTLGLTMENERLPALRVLDRVFLQSRVYKFVKMMVIGMRRDGFSRDRPGGPQDGDDGFPKKGFELYLRAHALEEKREYRKARELYEKFTALNPDHPAGYGRVGSCLFGEGRYEEAVRVLSQATRLQRAPETEMIYFDLGYALSRRGRSQEAVVVWKEGLKYFPDSVSLFQALARFYNERGEVKRALAYAEENPAMRENTAFAALKKSVSGGRETGKTGMRQFMASAAENREPDSMDLMISKSLKGDTLRIYEIGRSRGVSVLFASYPDHAYPEVVAAVREIEGRFVDFSSIFKDKFKNRDAYIAADNCHVNSRGYEVMAQALAEEIEAILGSR